MEKSHRRVRNTKTGERDRSQRKNGPGDLFVTRTPDLSVPMPETDSRKRILILTADVGFGHRRAAEALASALEEKYGDRVAVIVANPMSDKRTPKFLRNSQAEYDRMVREMPEIYRLRYQISIASVSVAVSESVFTAVLFGVLQDLVREVRPDVIVSTHPYYMAPIAALSTLGVYSGPQMTVITDFTQVHKLWFNDNSDMTFLPTEIALQEALEADIPETKLKVTGIPVDPKLVHETRTKAEIRAEMGWDPDLPLVLVVGSKRVKGLMGALNVLNHMGFQFQMVIVAGGDNKLYDRLQSGVWHKPVYIYNFIDNMASFFHAADCIVTKAGGLIVSESLACGLPLLLMDVTPGQEEGNAEYAVNIGAAQLATTPLRVLESMFHWLDQDGVLLREQAKLAAASGRPQSAYDIANTVMAAAEAGPVPVPEHRKSSVPGLKEWLSRNGIDIDFLL